jgi:ABC-2 type transport system permease protein
VSDLTIAREFARVRVIAERDWKLFVSYRLQMIMRAVSGVFVVVGLFFMGRLVGDSAALGPYSGRYLEFALVGVVFLAFVNVGLRTFSGTISNEQRAGTLEILLANPVRLPTLLTGMYVFPLAQVGLNMAVYITTAGALLGARFAVGGVPAAFVILLLTLVIFGAAGAISAAVIVITKRGDPVAALVAQMATLLGGAVFPVSVMPDWLAAVARLLPPYYALEGVRSAVILGEGFADVWTEIVILGGFAIVLVPLGLWLFSRALRQARIMGTLGNY